MTTIEGVSVEAQTVPEKRLVKIWNALTKQPFPKVKAFRLDDQDFDYVIQRRDCPEDEDREMKEWGRVLSPEGTDACVFNSDEHADVDYLILVRENPYHNLIEILEHELSHIVRGDL